MNLKKSKDGLYFENSVYLEECYFINNSVWKCFHFTVNRLKRMFYGTAQVELADTDGS